MEVGYNKTIFGRSLLRSEPLAGGQNESCLMMLDFISKDNPYQHIAQMICSQHPTEIY